MERVTFNGPLPKDTKQNEPSLGFFNRDRPQPLTVCGPESQAEKKHDDHSLQQGNGTNVEMTASTQSIPHESSLPRMLDCHKPKKVLRPLTVEEKQDDLSLPPGVSVKQDACHTWTLHDSFREVIQNTIDGAVEYMVSQRPELKKADLRPAGKGWYMTKTKKKSLPKLYQNAGFLHGGKAEMVLSVSTNGDASSTNKLPGKKNSWLKCEHSYAYISLEYVSRREINWESFEETGQQPEGTILIKFEAQNRALESFRIGDLCWIGQTSKFDQKHTAGKFGEGFIFGAAVAQRNGVDVEAQRSRGRKLIFAIDKKTKAFGFKKYKCKPDEAKADPGMVSVKLHLKNPPVSTALESRYHFDVSSFRLLHPGSPYAANGEILRGTSNKGKIFCMGIFVYQDGDYILGYDIGDKDLIAGRDRNGTTTESKSVLREKIAKLLKRCNKDDKEFIPYLLEQMLEIKEERKLKRAEEVHAIYRDEELCKDLSLCFKTKEKDAFPIKKLEEKKFNESLRNIRPIVLLDTLVEILRIGIYRSIDEELDFLLSDENKFEVDDTGKRLLESCVFRLNRVNDNFQVALDSIVVVNSHYLNTKHHCCKACTKEGLTRFYFPCDFLRITKSFLRTSNQLGFEIASKIRSMEVDGMRVEGLENFLFDYSEENGGPARSWYQMEISNCQRYLKVCEKLRAVSNVVRVTKLAPTEGLLHETFEELPLSEELVRLPDNIEATATYLFVPLDQNGEEKLFDPLAQELCSMQHLFRRLDNAVEDDQGEDIQAEDANDDIASNGSFDLINDYDDPLSSNNDVEDDDSHAYYLTDGEMDDVFGEEDDDEDSEPSSESEYEDEEDEDEEEEERVTKRPRRTLPCDEPRAVFSGKEIIRGKVYSHLSGQDEWYVRVDKFLGKKNVHRARCHILKPLHSAVTSFFNNSNNPFDGQHESSFDAGFDSLPSKIEFDEVVESAGQLVFEEAEMGCKFMATLLPSYADFDKLSRDAKLVTKREHGKWVEFRCRELEPSDFEIDPERTPQELVLFAGVGGCSIGDKQAGFKVKWLVEINALVAASLRGSHPKAMIYQENVVVFNDNCEAGKPGVPQRGQVDHFQASSPCQGFSSANRNGGQNDRKNNLLSLEVIRTIEILRPRTGMMENVSGMLRPNHRKYVYQILHESIALGYQVRLALHNAHEFGGAQKRKRLIFTFARNDTRLPELPTPTLRSATLRDAIQGLPKDCERESGSGIVELPNGKLTFNHVASKPRADMETLDGDEAVNTLTTQNSASLAHPDNPDRTLSMRELARLFSYPDDKQFFGSLTAIRRQIGNSVPVDLAYAIARPIFEVYNCETDSDDEDSWF